MSDEEKKAIETIEMLIKKQSKKIEELSDKFTEKICKGVEEYRQTIISKNKEIEALKEDNKKEKYCNNRISRFIRKIGRQNKSKNRRI